MNNYIRQNSTKEQIDKMDAFKTVFESTNRLHIKFNIVRNYLKVNDKGDLHYSVFNKYPFIIIQWNENKPYTILSYSSLYDIINAFTPLNIDRKIDTFEMLINRINNSN